MSRDSKTLVHVATNTFLAKWFWKVKELSFGLIDLKPMDINGIPIPMEKFEETVIKQCYEPELFCDYLREISEKNEDPFVDEIRISESEQNEDPFVDETRISESEQNEDPFVDEIR